jgi:hypothetical protein
LGRGRGPGHGSSCCTAAWEHACVSGHSGLQLQTDMLPKRPLFAGILLPHSHSARSLRVARRAACQHPRRLPHPHPRSLQVARRAACQHPRRTRQWLWLTGPAGRPGPRTRAAGSRRCRRSSTRLRPWPLHSRRSRMLSSCRWVVRPLCGGLNTPHVFCRGGGGGGGGRQVTGQSVPWERHG